MRVVVDTSVLLAAAFENDANCWRVLDLLERCDLTPVFNVASWEELVMVPWESPGDYVSDPGDEKIIAAGLDGNVWFIIHRDQAISSVPPLIVVTEGHMMVPCWPDEFVAHYPDFLQVLHRKVEKRFAAS